MQSSTTMPSASPTDRFVGRVIADKYRLEERVGSGGMGHVYRATQLVLEKTVAIKILHPDPDAPAHRGHRFRDEALAASRLDHANSVRILDFGTDDFGQSFIAMEFIAGRSLFEVMNGSGPLELSRIVGIMSQTLSALAAAHDVGVVHRDLKPENLMLLPPNDDDETPSEVVKITDFGIAKFASDRKYRLPTRPAITDFVMGTPEYMAPEQACAGEVDGRSDLYSCGVVLYQLATGRLPFECDNPVDLVLKHATEAPPPPSHWTACDPRLEALILKALAKDPADRFASAREMRTALRAILPSATLATDSDKPPAATHDAPVCDPDATRTLSEVPGALTNAPPQSARRAALHPRARKIAAALSALLISVLFAHAMLSRGPMRGAAIVPASLANGPAPATATKTSRVAPPVIATTTAPDTVVDDQDEDSTTEPVRGALDPAYESMPNPDRPDFESDRPPPAPRPTRMARAAREAPPVPSTESLAPMPASYAAPTLEFHARLDSLSISGGAARLPFEARVNGATRALARCVSRQARDRQNDALESTMAVTIIVDVRDRRLDRLDVRGGASWLGTCARALGESFAGNLPPSHDNVYRLTIGVSLTAQR